MSTTDAPRRTRPSTATARPAKILLDVKIKRRSPAQKAADDLVIKEVREAKEAAHQKGVERVAALQAEMEKAQKELLMKKVTPIRPKPRAKAIKPKAAQTKSVVGDTGGGDSPADSGLLEDLVSETDVARDVENKAAGRGKKMVTKKVAKMSLIRDAISNVQKKLNESSKSKVEGDNAHADGKSLINTSTKLALGGRVTNWRSDVKPGNPEQVSCPSIDSTSTRPPPSSIFSEGTASSALTSVAELLTKIPAALPQIPDGVPDDTLTGAFADDINDSLEREDALLGTKQNKGKSKVVTLYEEDYDVDEPEAPLEALDESDDELMAPLTQVLPEERYSQEPKVPFTQVDNLMLLKQKASFLDNEESLVSQWSMEIDGNAELIEDAIMSSDSEAPLPVKTNTAKKEKILCTTYSTSVTASQAIVDSKPPAHKKAKVKSSALRAHGAPATTHQQNTDTAPDNIKACSAYRTVDLPAAMQADQCWAKNFIPTIMLWAGSYEDIWSIPDEVLLHHAQLVFNAVYNDLGIVIVHGGVIQWRSNFGSTGLVIIMDFLSQNSDVNPVELVKSLLVDWAFLFENPDNPSPLTAYCSPFVLQLFGTAHLNAIIGYVEVRSFDMHALATSGMLRPLALSAAAIECTITMIADGELKVRDVLSSASRGWVSIRLLKVLNKVTGKETNIPFLFLAALWLKPTNSFIKSLLGKPTGYLETTVQMVCATLNDVTETLLDSLNDDESEDDKRAMISPASA
ncbi:uncharacterized protein F5891DRAFT_1186154 [Suillus fuscotomentosus]|uniref:Uncharacterized protein n=1 Tax=Suillus fuscotomentosus TaxID=1912939 RepID=A0AAD4HMV9_9AGAM|nr:uncharacterized protein F5891DRAFT_1186154 [Suillus fuscotomentosus]KAG1902518.1 hypothetical protein F5891DRAFT_1186154 [Suillus fuscotomentosus]